MRSLVACLALVLVTSLSGCPKQGDPSPAYAEATKDFNALYGRHVEEAYTMPEMAAIEAKLESVPRSPPTTRARRRC